MTKETRAYKGVTIVSSINVLGKLGWYVQKTETRPPSYTIHQNKFKMDETNINHDIIKILEEKKGSKILDVSHSIIFANIYPRKRKIKEKINKWDYIKLKSFCIAKETIIKMKRELTIW